MTSASSISIPVLHGRYRIEEKLGVGRLAVVYRARDERLQRPVLLHMLRKELLAQEPLRQRFIQEAHASARRSHQSLLEVFDSGEVANRPYMITEYVAGRTLRELGALSLEDTLLYFRQVVGAVAACQAAGVPHPPITSNNLVLVDEGHVELLESWQTPPQQVAIDLACYRAPERTEGQPATPAAAVYALGLLLFEMLTGQRAITGADPHAIAHMHRSVHVPRLSEVQPTVYAPSLERLLQRATAHDPAQRPHDAVALGQELDDLRRTMLVETQRLVPSTHWPAPREQSRRRTGNVSDSYSYSASERTHNLEQQIPTVPADQLGGVPIDYRARYRNRSITGMIIMVVLFASVACGTYYLASQAINRVLGFQIPIPEVQLPELPAIGVNLPEWLTGVVSGGGQVLVVSSLEGLNMRAEPGRTADIVGSLPNGARVRWAGGVDVADGVPWLRVRGRAITPEGEREIEGWVSALYMRTTAGQPPEMP